jgi:hypothetical protein
MTFANPYINWNMGNAVNASMPDLINYAMIFSNIKSMGRIYFYHTCIVFIKVFFMGTSKNKVFPLTKK